MTKLELENITAEKDGATLLDRINVRFAVKELTAIIGPNGAGKSSLLKCAIGLLPPASGIVLSNGEPIADLTPIERARRIAYLPQMRPLAWPARVRDVAALGRYAYGGNLSKLTGDDAKAVQAALDECDLSVLADRNTDTLSGGELARVHCARAFAAGAPFLLADEPVASLDPHQQLRIMSFIRRFADQGGGAVVVLHDISLAAKFADRLVWMKEGRIIANGPPAETLTAERMRDVFNVNAGISEMNGVVGVTISEATN